MLENAAVQSFSALSMGRSTRPAQEMKASGSQYEPKEKKEGNASKRSPSAGDLRTFVSRCAHIAYDCPPLIWKGPGFGPRYWGGFPQRRGGDGARQPATGGTRRWIYAQAVSI